MATVEQVLVEFKGRNEVTPVQKSISNSMKDVQGSTVGVQGAFNRMGSVGRSAFTSLKSGVSSFVDNMSGVSGAISGVIAGFGAMQMASMMVGGAMQREFNTAQLSMKFGAATAKELSSAINDIVSKVPGDDTFMGQLLSGAAYKAGLTNVEVLKQLGNVTADYLAASKGMGKSAIETQMDLKEYILTGNTTQLERDSILKGQLDKLKGQETVEGRMKALQEGLNAEGYAGMATMDITANVLEEVKGKLQSAASTIGLSILPTIKGVLDFFIGLDEATGGWSSQIIFIGGLVIALVGSLGLVAAPIAGVAGALAGVAAVAVGALVPGMTAATAANMGLVGTLNMGWQSLLVWALGSDIATVSTMSFTAATKALFLAILTNPITWVVIAIIALVVIIYEAGKAWGWWTDLASFGAAIWSGLVGVFQNLWNVISGFLSWIGGVATGIWEMFTSSFYDSEGHFVGLVEGFKNLGTKIWEAVWPGLQALPGQIWGALTGLFSGMGKGAGGIGEAIGGLFKIDWGSIAMSMVSGIANWNPVTLMIRLLFGDKAANQFATSITSFFSSLFNLDFQGMFNNLVQLFASYNPVTMIIRTIFGPAAAAKFSTSITQLITTAVKTFTTLPGRIVSVLASAPARIAMVFTLMINRIRSILALVFDVVTAPFRMALSGLTGIASSIWGSVTSIFWNGVNIIGGAMNTVSGWVTNAWNTITGAFNNAVSIISGAVSNIYNTIVSNIGGAIDYLKRLICPIIGCSPGIIPAFQEMGVVVPREINRIMPHLNKLGLGNVTPGVNIPQISGGMGGGAGTVIHYHNEVIDARNWSKDELMSMLYIIYNGQYQAAAPIPTTNPGGV